MTYVTSIDWWTSVDSQTKNQSKRNRSLNLEWTMRADPRLTNGMWGIHERIRLVQWPIILKKWGGRAGRAPVFTALLALGWCSSLLGWVSSAVRQCSLNLMCAWQDYYHVYRGIIFHSVKVQVKWLPNWPIILFLCLSCSSVYLVLTYVLRHFLSFSISIFYFLPVFVFASQVTNQPTNRGIEEPNLHTPPIILCSTTQYLRIESVCACVVRTGTWEGENPAKLSCLFYLPTFIVWDTLHSNSSV